MDSQLVMLHKIYKKIHIWLKLQFNKMGGLYAIYFNFTLKILK